MGSYSSLYRLRESDSTELKLDQSDISHLQTEWEKIGVTVNDPTVTITPDRTVGVIGLPSGATLEIEPKVRCNLLFLLAASGSLDENLAYESHEAGFETGKSFIEIIATLFERELDRIITRGLEQQYQVHENTLRFLRGQLDIQKQLHRQGPVATQFECRYDELSHSTIANQVLLETTTVLCRLVEDETLRRPLTKYRGMLRRQITVEQGIVDRIEEIEFTHLNNYYRRAIKLAKLILSSHYINRFAGRTRSFESLTFDMATTFENALYQASKTAFERNSRAFKITRNDLGPLVKSEQSSKPRRLEPDLIVRRRSDDQVVLVGDVKWKKHSAPSRNDLYQIATYQAKYSTPGILLYPLTNDNSHDRYDYIEDSVDRPSLYLRTIEINTSSSYDQFQNHLQDKLYESLSSLINENRELVSQSASRQ